MAGTVVETPNARYVLMFTDHFEIAEKSPCAFDALVLEIGGLQPKKAGGTIMYSKLVGQAMNSGKSVWVTDAKATTASHVLAVGGRASSILAYFTGLSRIYKHKKIGRMAFIAGVLAPIASSIGTSVIKGRPKEIKCHKIWNITTKAAEATGGQGLLTARNLVSAEKCEGWLAPRLKKELGRKPTIAMAWGSGHYGIKELLENPEKRKRLLKKYNIERWVKEPGKAYRLHLNAKGAVEKVEEFGGTFGQRGVEHGARETEQGARATNRRKFLARFVPRRRA